jgi:hypothetical protein
MNLFFFELFEKEANLSFFILYSFYHFFFPIRIISLTINNK